MLKELRNFILRILQFYSGVVIIFYNTGLSKSPFSTQYFRKLVFRLSVFYIFSVCCFFFFLIRCLIYRIYILYNIYLITFQKQICKSNLAICDVATYLTSVLTNTSKRKPCFQGGFEVFFKKKSFIRKMWSIPRT